MKLADITSSPPLKLALCLLLLSSCTINPTLYTDAKGRDVVTLGGSILTKVKAESASIARPDGTTLSFTRSGKNEVSVPNAYIAGQVAEGLADIAAGVSSTSIAAEVSKAGMAADVSKTQIEATKAVDLLKHAPVE